MDKNLPSTEVRSFKVSGVVVSRSNVERDPLNIDVRTYIRIHSILERIEAGEEVTLREEIAALALIERLRPKDTTSNADAGSSVRKYEGAFKNDTRGRKKVSRRAEPDADGVLGDERSDWFEQSGDDAGSSERDH